MGVSFLGVPLGILRFCQLNLRPKAPRADNVNAGPHDGAEFAPMRLDEPAPHAWP